MQSTTKQKVRVPADICRWPVGYASRKIYVALLVFQLRAERYQRQSVLKTYEEIAELSGVANVKTVAAAIRELSNAGYIQVKTHMYWSEDGQKLYRGTNEYTVLPLASMGAGYIWVPVKLLTARISPASFTGCCCTFCANKVKIQDPGPPCGVVSRPSARRTGKQCPERPSALPWSSCAAA